MTIVYFIRHAEPNYANRDEFSRDLTPKGIAQSERLLDVFRGIDIDVFFQALTNRRWIRFIRLPTVAKKHSSKREAL